MKTQDLTPACQGELIEKEKKSKLLPIDIRKILFNKRELLAQESSILRVIEGILKCPDTHKIIEGYERAYLENPQCIVKISNGKLQIASGAELFTWNCTGTLNQMIIDNIYDSVQEDILKLETKISESEASLLDKIGGIIHG